MDFEKLVVWQRSTSLAVSIYRELAGCRELVFRNQVTRAALSVPSNIAEGMERSSAKEKCYFLRIARGSCGELRTQMIIGSEIGYIRPPLAELWIPESRELSKMLGGLINTISQ
jgi:four helix bundle protein